MAYINQPLVDVQQLSMYEIINSLLFSVSSIEAGTERRKGAVKGQSKHSRGCCRASSTQDRCPVSFRAAHPPAEQRSQHGSLEPRKQALPPPVPFSREREENCGAKVYSNCLKRKGHGSLSVCLNSRLQPLSPLLWKAESMAHQLQSTFCCTAILRSTPGNTKDGARSSRNLVPSAGGHVGQGNLQSLLPTEAQPSPS